MRPLCLVLFLAALVGAQERVVAPHTGTVLGPDGSIRFIRGVPGAAYSEPDTTRTSFLALQSASHAAVAVGITSTSVHVISESRSRSVALPIESAAAVAVSPQGKYFAVLSGETLRIYETASGDPRSSYSLGSFGLAISEPVNVAISDHGAAIIAAGKTTVYADTSGRVSYAPLKLIHPRFLPAGKAVFVAYSQTNNTLVMIHLPALAAEILASERDGLSTPTGIEFSRDARHLWLSTSAVSALSYSFETRLLTTHALPSGQLRPIGSPGVFQWTPDSVLDTNRTPVAVLLVPERSQEAQ